MKKNILFLNEIKLDNETLRLDAEHFSKENLALKKKLIDCDGKELSEFIKTKVVTGHTPSMKNDSYYGGDIKFIKTDNLRDFYISDSFSHFLTDKGNEKIGRSVLRENDLIVTIIGATHDIVGRASLVTNKDIPSNINQNIALIRLKNNLKPHFFVVYLNSKYGKRYLWYLSRQTEQVNLNCREVEKLLVPKFTDPFQQKIQNIVINAYRIVNESNRRYKEAEEILLSEMGFLNWEAKHRLHFAKYYSDTVQAGRFDAEYFQPKYEELVEAIQTYPGGWDSAEKLLTIKDKAFQPENKKEYQYIELANIVGNGDIIGCTIAEGHELPTRARRRVTTSDVIISSIEGSLSSIALITEEYNAALCSTGFYVVRCPQINSESLLVLMKTIIGKLQLSKGCSGTILAAIKKEEFNKIILPILRNSIQEKIKQKITESFALRKQSKYLFECADKAVEEAIESNEDSAIKWLENQKLLIEM